MLRILCTTQMHLKKFPVSLIRALENVSYFVESQRLEKNSLDLKNLV